MKYDENEYELAGALRGAPGPIATAPLTALPVPWGSEVVIEGVIEGRKREIEGPFGEFTGHYSGGRNMTVIRIDGSPTAATRSSSTSTSPADEDEQALQRLFELLQSEYQRLADRPLEVHLEVVRHLLAVLLLRLAHLPAPREPAQAGTEAFRRFQQAVEDGFTRTHRVQHYARQLGYSVRTLTRATQTAVGCGARVRR
jgi:hypothetical protein